MREWLNIKTKSSSNFRQLSIFVPSIGINDINECPYKYAAYYQPFNCLAVSSIRAGAIIFIVFGHNRVLFCGHIDFGSRIRKFVISDNRILAVTDNKGVIVGAVKSVE